MTPSRRGFSLPDRIGRPVARGTYVAQIDGLRCLAIVAVLVWHVSLRASRHAGSIVAPQGSVTDLYGYIPHGEIGVALFFFVSGFVIAQPFLGRPRAQWRIGQFYLRRFRRIYPPYVIVLTFCFAVVAIGGFSRLPSDLSPAESWLASLLYLHGALFQQPSRLDPPVWSLEIEVQFYLLAPLIVALYLRPSRLAARIGLGAAAIAVLIVASSLFDAVHPFDGRFRFGLLAHLHLFVAGIVVADLSRTTNLLGRPASFGCDLLLLLGMLCLIMAGVYLTSVDNRPGLADRAIACHLTVLTAVSCIYFGAMQGRIGRRILGAPWIALIGTMCFSIYLVHVVVIEAAATLVLRHIPLQSAASIWGTYLAVSLPASLLVGGLFYVTVERPFMSPDVLRGLALARWMRWRASAAERTPIAQQTATGAIGISPITAPER